MYINALEPKAAFFELTFFAVKPERREHPLQSRQHESNIVHKSGRLCLTPNFFITGKRDLAVVQGKVYENYVADKESLAVLR